MSKYALKLPRAKIFSATMRFETFQVGLCPIKSIYNGKFFSIYPKFSKSNFDRNILRQRGHRIKISNRRATQRCNVSSFFYAKICSLLARRRSSQPVQRVYWPENVIDWLGKWRPTCVMRHARGQKLQSFRRKDMDLYSMTRRAKDSFAYVQILHESLCFKMCFKILLSQTYLR